jgi:hypothetical protein
MNLTIQKYMGWKKLWKVENGRIIFKKQVIFKNINKVWAKKGPL